MDRRKFIAGVSGIGITTGLSGCVEESRKYYEGQADAGGSEDESEGKETDENTSAGGLQIRHPPTDDLEFLEYEFEFVDRASYPDQPAQIEVTLKNTTDEVVEYGDARNAIFWFVSSDAYTLVPAQIIREEGYRYNSEFDVWESMSQFGQTLEYQITQLQPNQEVSVRLLVLHQRIPVSTESVSDLSTEQKFETGFQIRSPETRDGFYTFTLHYEE